MLRTGRPAFKYSFFKRAMFSNWALRFGLRGPIVFFFNAFRLRYLCLRSNWETTCRLAGVPNSVTRRAISPRDKFVHFTSARIGSPAVWSSRTFKKFSSRVAEISINFLRPPLFFGHDWCPDRLPLPVPPVLGGWSWDRTSGVAQCTRPHHAPAWWPRQPRSAVDHPRPVSQRAASSCVRFPVHRRTCCPPPCFAPSRGLDNIFRENREAICGTFLRAPVSPSTPWHHPPQSGPSWSSLGQSHAWLPPPAPTPPPPFAPQTSPKSSC